MVFSAKTTGRGIMAEICVLSGSKAGTDPAFSDAAAAFGRAIGESGKPLICGGAASGLMQVCADAVHAAGGRVNVIIPSAYLAHEKQPAYAHVTEVVDAAERMRIFKQRASAFIALPGAFGTLTEVAELSMGRQYGDHSCPVVAYNANGFWNGMIEQVRHMQATGFVKQSPLVITPSRAVILQFINHPE